MKIIDQIFQGKNVEMQVDDNGVLWFEIESLSMAIGYVTKAKGKEYVHKSRMNKTLKNAEITTVVRGVQQWITEQQMYDFLIEAHTEKSKDFKRWITDKVLPTIEKTGAYIEPGQEQKMVSYYFSSLSQDTQGIIVNELIQKNKELQQFYDDLMNTEGLMPINTVAKELGIGEYKLFAYLRRKKIFFYDKDNVNVPYERFRKEGKFAVKETLCHDGQIRSVTYATKKGLEYIRKLLRKDGYYTEAA